jgi:hypothetical protein
MAQGYVSMCLKLVNLFLVQRAKGKGKGEGTGMMMIDDVLLALKL